MYLISLRKGQYTDVISYNAIIQILYTQLRRKFELKDKGQFFSFREVTDHDIIKGTNFIYEVLISWEDGYVTWSTLSMIQRDDPIYLTYYDCDHDLLDNPG